MKDHSDCGTVGLSPLMGWQEALARGLALAFPVAQTESLALHAACGRVTAGPVVTPIALPPFDNSAMDGFALNTADLAGPGPWHLPLAGRVAAGDAGLALPPGHALRILTGAPVPPEADAVVMQEHVRRLDDAIDLETRPRSGLNIRRAAEDMAPGGEVLPAGRVIGPREAGVLAATGAARVTVRRRVRVALICSGSELRELADGAAPLGPGQIWNANRAMLVAALSLAEVELIDLGSAPDDPVLLAARLQEASQRADLVISTGGMSEGDEDHMPRLLRAAGAEVQAMRVAIKPGKPVAIGKLGGAVYLGLPGNPVACLVTWSCFGMPILRKLSGRRDVVPVFSKVEAGFDLTRHPGRAEFRPAEIIGLAPSGLPRVQPMTPSYAARIALLARADGLALIPAETGAMRSGDLLDFLSF